jgi:hypothetical protein
VNTTGSPVETGNSKRNDLDVDPRRVVSTGVGCFGFDAASLSI